MAAILNAPKPLIGGRNALCVGLLARLAGDAVDSLASIIAGLFIRTMPLDYECLSHMGEVEVIVEFGGDPGFAGLNACMIEDSRIWK